MFVRAYFFDGLELRRTLESKFDKALVSYLTLWLN
jgi:hypothetical protein